MRQKTAGFRAIRPKAGLNLLGQHRAALAKGFMG